MARFHTTASLFTALRQVIPNLPQYAVTIDIHLGAQGLPTMDVKQELMLDGIPIVEDGAIKTEVKRFRIVPIEETEEPTT